jgi:hypothetical protein
MLASSRESFLIQQIHFLKIKSLKMKKIFLGLLAIALIGSPAVYANGGKKKAKKKAKIECSKNNCCYVKACSTGDKCYPIPVCSGGK